MARWLSHKPPLPTWHGNITHNMTWFHFISFHPLPSGCIQVRLSCTRISDKVPVVRPPGIPDYFQKFPDIMLREADSAQASRRYISEFSSRSEVFQKSPDYMFRIASIQIFIPRFQRVIHHSCSPSNHVTTKHSEKQHHAVTILFCRSLVACWTAGNSNAVVCFCQPSSMQIALNAVKLPLVLSWSKQNTTPHWWHPRPMYTDIWAPRSMSQPSTERNSTMPLPALFAGRWLLLNSRKLWCSGLLLSAFSVELAHFGYGHVAKP